MDSPQPDNNIPVNPLHHHTYCAQNSQSKRNDLFLKFLPVANLLIKTINENQSKPSVEKKTLKDAQCQINSNDLPETPENKPEAIDGSLSPRSAYIARKFGNTKNYLKAQIEAERNKKTEMSNLPSFSGVFSNLDLLYNDSIRNKKPETISRKNGLKNLEIHRPGKTSRDSDEESILSVGSTEYDDFENEEELTEFKMEISENPVELIPEGHISDVFLQAFIFYMIRHANLPLLLDICHKDNYSDLQHLFLKLFPAETDQYDLKVFLKLIHLQKIFPCRMPIPECEIFSKNIRNFPKSPYFEMLSAPERLQVLIDVLMSVKEIEYVKILDYLINASESENFRIYIQKSPTKSRIHERSSIYAMRFFRYIMMNSEDENLKSEVMDEIENINRLFQEIFSGTPEFSLKKKIYLKNLTGILKEITNIQRCPETNEDCLALIQDVFMMKKDVPITKIFECIFKSSKLDEFKVFVKTEMSEEMEVNEFESSEVNVIDLTKPLEDSTFAFETVELALKNDWEYEAYVRTMNSLKADRERMIKMKAEIERRESLKMIDETANEDSNMEKRLQTNFSRMIFTEIPGITPPPSGLEKIMRINYFDRVYTTYQSRSKQKKLHAPCTPFLSEKIIKLSEAWQPQIKLPKKSPINADFESSSLAVRGRTCVRGTPTSNFNKLWTKEEQCRLEQLLHKYPAEIVEAKRYRKIAAELGSRTQQQVASRVQKYFIKLTQAGLPVPGRLPSKPSIPIPKKPYHRHYYHNFMRHQSTFLTNITPRVFMAEDSDDEMKRADAERIREEREEEKAKKMKNRGKVMWNDGVFTWVNPDFPQRLRNTPEFKKLLMLNDAKTKANRHKRGLPLWLRQHDNVKCLACHTEPIVGDRWNCITCTEDDTSFDFCDKCKDMECVEGAAHFDHEWQRIGTPIGKPFLDPNFVSFSKNPHNYLDPNFMPQLRKRYN